MVTMQKTLQIVKASPLITGTTVTDRYKTVGLSIAVSIQHGYSGACTS
jgi:hypothetical protein